MKKTITLQVMIDAELFELLKQAMKKDGEESVSNYVRRILVKRLRR